VGHYLGLESKTSALFLCPLPSEMSMPEAHFLRIEYAGNHRAALGTMSRSLLGQITRVLNPYRGE
jgi:hypothetical protein